MEKFLCKLCQTEFTQEMSTKPYAQCPVCFSYTVYPSAIKELYQRIADNPELQKLYKDLLDGKDKVDKTDNTKAPNTNNKKGRFQGFKWIPAEKEE
jgi:hypothetical protein